jgi:molybdenum cofactor cytidylyltransferase
MKTSVNVDGVILAAGQSRRMGEPKAALPTAAGESFLERAAHTLHAAGCRRVLVVVNAAASARAEPNRGTERLDLEIVVNADANSEQIDSLRLALQRLDESTDAVLVLPVDLPLIAVETAVAVVSAFREQSGPVVVPAHGGVAGHPILLGRELFAEIAHGVWEEGMRSFLLAHVNLVRMVNVDDPGILIDIDTRDDYVRHISARE